MTNEVRTLALRLAKALGFDDVEPEYFADEACWALVAKLEEYMNAQKQLDPVVLRLLEDLTIAMNARGMDESVIVSALEGQLGPCPFPPDTVIAITKFVRGQLHFVTKAQPVKLDGSPTHVPLKNFDFE